MLSRKRIKEFKEEEILIHYDKPSGDAYGSVQITGSKVGILTALATTIHALLKSNEFTLIDFKELIKTVEVAENELE
jgi:hypothetical protein